MKSIHALLVDDDKQSLETMGLILEMDDYQVSRAESGLKALEILERAEEHPPTVDFMVVDLDMDNLSGIELLTEMRRRGHAVPVMVVTGFASKGTVVELLRHGVADFLDKPIHMEEFRIRVRQIANEALRRRRRLAAGPDGNTVPAVPETAPFRSVTVLDLGNLGIPYALRRLVDSPDRNNLVMACRRQDGFDILLADVPGNDAESFYASVLIKTFFDRCRAQRMESGGFMSALNRVILDGALKKRDLGAIFIRVHHAERKIEIHPAGLPCQCFLGLRGATPRNLAFAGSPLGVVPDPGATSCVFPYARGDRIFLVSETDASRKTSSEPHGTDLRIHESLLSGRHESLAITADGIWRDMLFSAHKGENADSLLLGLELI